MSITNIWYEIIIYEICYKYVIYLKWVCGKKGKKSERRMREERGRQYNLAEIYHRTEGFFTLMMMVFGENIRSMNNLHAICTFLSNEKISHYGIQYLLTTHNTVVCDAINWHDTTHSVGNVDQPLHGVLTLWLGNHSHVCYS